MEISVHFKFGVMMKQWGLLGLIVVSTLCLRVEAHTDITVHQAYTMMHEDPNIIVVDGREESDYCGTLGHVPGAYNYPYNSGVFQNNYTDFNPNEPIMLICHSGTRSNNGSNFLDSKDFLLVYDILGGTSLWDNYYPTVGCIDNDKDGINDDLDNHPDAFNPTQAEIIWLGDFAGFANLWRMDGANGLIMEDLLNFCQHWLEATP